MRRALDRVGFAVLTTASAIEGQKLIDKHEPSLVILDLHLPDRPGTGSAGCAAIARAGKRRAGRGLLQ